MADVGDATDKKSDIDLKMEASPCSKIESSTSDMDQESFFRPGAQLTDKQSFNNKKGKEISGYPVIVDFRRLLQLTDGSSKTNLQDFGIIQGISNRDLLHAVIGLYDVSLSEMTPDVLYSTVCEKWSRTIILIRDLQETIDDLEARRKQEPVEKEEDEEEDEAGTESAKGSEVSGDEDIYEAEEESPSRFSEVFSDTDTDVEEEEEEDEEDFSKGINSFINGVIERRKARKSCEGPITEDMVGIENRIVGCATFEKKYVKHKDRVIHLTLVSVRKRCRGLGIGKFLLSQIVDPKVVGHYDAIVVHADNEAVDFFQKFGFSDDIVLNSRWVELAEQFTNCTLMCYLPGFSGHRLLTSIKPPGLEVYELEQEFLKWKEKTLEVYQQQVTCMMRMKHECLQLKYTAATQDRFLKVLVEENERLKTEKLETEKEFLDYRLQTAKTTFGNEDTNKKDDENISTQELIDNLQRQVDKMDLKIKNERTHSRDLIEALNTKPNGSYTVVDESRYLAFSQSEGKGDEEPYDHIKDSAFFYDVTQQFKQQMKLDPLASRKHEVSTVSKALVPEKVRKLYKEKLKTLTDPLMVLDLYFCGTLEHPERIKEILKQGFSEIDFSCGEYGRGLYFSKYPSKAAQFSELGHLLKVEVGIGNVETVVKTDRTRAGPSKGYDSILTPGRLLHILGQGSTTMNQEYIVFDTSQCMPLCLLSYETS